MSILEEMIEYCEKNKVEKFYQLVDYATQIKNDKWCEYINKNSWLIENYFKSKYNN